MPSSIQANNQDMTGLPLWRRCAFQVELSIRFDEPLFLWDCTWHEEKRYRHQYAWWWPRFNVAVLGVRFGFALFIGRRKIDVSGE